MVSQKFPLASALTREASYVNSTVCEHCHSDFHVSSLWKATTQFHVLTPTTNITTTITTTNACSTFAGFSANTEPPLKTFYARLLVNTEAENGEVRIVSIRIRNSSIISSILDHLWTRGTSYKYQRRFKTESLTRVTKGGGEGEEEVEEVEEEEEEEEEERVMRVGVRDEGEGCAN
uniref:Uncharacterized protein n=1 Tax=Vespula pensylvanica TaxID=30213 RepID=A0A834UD95_VESPE|nr:hypothetical protein H0235_004835 [Vespula pensylvanica]